MYSPRRVPQGVVPEAGPPSRVLQWGSHKGVRQGGPKSGLPQRMSPRALPQGWSPKGDIILHSACGGIHVVLIDWSFMAVLAVRIRWWWIRFDGAGGNGFVVVLAEFNFWWEVYGGGCGVGLVVVFIRFCFCDWGGSDVVVLWTWYGSVCAVMVVLLLRPLSSGCGCIFLPSVLLVVILLWCSDRRHQHYTATTRTARPHLKPQGDVHSHPTTKLPSEPPRW
jgi:hypothetical protein